MFLAVAARSCWFLLLVGFAAETAGCGQHAEPPAKADAPPVQWQGPRKLNVEHLPNAYQVHAKVISGGLPEGEEAFRELADLGVKTIISVDGAKPDMALAKKYGLRYVHLPHGYDGVPESRVKELAKAVRDLPGPIYIHCHHGKHRSPTAAAVACIAAGLLDSDSAMTILHAAGTSEGYRGLYESAREARPLDGKLLDALRPEFPEIAKIPPLAEAMVAIEHTHDHLKQMAAAGWKSPPEHPDLTPAHEALQLREQFTELLRTEDAKPRPERFQQYLHESEAAATDLEDALGGLQADDATGALARINKSCTDCHHEFRDTPLGEKPLGRK